MRLLRRGTPWRLCKLWRIQHSYSTARKRPKDFYQKTKTVRQETREDNLLLAQAANTEPMTIGLQKLFQEK